MLEYVKICPKCSHINPESAGDICGREGCNEFLGFVQPIPQPSMQTPSESPLPEPPKQPDPSPQGQGTTGQQKPTSDVTHRFIPPHPLYLEVPGTSMIYHILSGNMFGQAHPTSNAQVQVSGIHGVNEIHRHHCLFECVDGQWCVVAIRQPSGKFTNPTYVNQSRLESDQKYPLHNGDKLTLSGVTFNVRLLQS